MFACGTPSPTPEQTGTGGKRREKLQPFVHTRFRTCVRAAWTFHWRSELAGHPPPVPTARDGPLDIKREPPKKTKKIVGAGLGLVAIVAVTVAISRLRPAAPPVERGTLWIDTVKQGSMTRDVKIGRAHV